MRNSIGIVILFVLVIHANCRRPPANAKTVNTSVKNAWMMYHEAGPSLKPPSQKRTEVVHRFGQERFVTDLSKFLQTKYRAEAIYCLGHFGDERHVRPISEALSDSDARVCEVALMSFSLLTHTEHADAAQAREWWDSHKDDFP